MSGSLPGKGVAQIRAAPERETKASPETSIRCKTAEFREALLAILGIKIAFYYNGQIQVTSQYNLGAAPVFQPAPRDAAKNGNARARGCSGLRRAKEGHKSCRS